MLKRFKLRCRESGIVITETPGKYDIVWCSEFRPDIYPMDALDLKNDAFKAAIDKTDRFGVPLDVVLYN